MRICVVGAGTRFLSGISYYTARLANALASKHRVSAILMRQLLPTFLYPGKDRVGKDLTDLKYDADIRVFDGIDWYWLPSIVRALALLSRERPDVLIFQWWSGTVVHSYVLLALIARLYGSRVVVEFHEVLDPAEMRLLPARFYVGLMGPVLMRLSSGFVVHTKFDLEALEKRYNLSGRPVELIQLGPFDHHLAVSEVSRREAPAGCCNLLYFGVIRPFKGLEDLVTAFDSIPEGEIDRYWLTVVGETWEGWTLPSELIAKSRYRDRITFVNRYVTDEEVAGYFAGADVVVLPYHRSSASGPLHTAMSHGLPVIVTAVGGLVEAVSGYEGAVAVPPQDSPAIRSALTTAAGMISKRYSDPHSWEQNVERYTHLFGALAPGRQMPKEA
jgi:glycosyltransferase involved in cell wall biosynthesis